FSPRIFVLLIGTQKIQLSWSCYEAFCSQLLIIITKLTVKFTFQFQGATRYVSGHIVCPLHYWTVQGSHDLLEIKVMSEAVSSCNLTFLSSLIKVTDIT
ncbi:unnamed protein product, partial [Hymenolepis diminuta]